MADEKTFASLLTEAPLYQKSDTVSLTGALARSPEEGKFALVQADGSALTLDSDAVRSHTVIGSAFGQQIVQVEMDAEKVPEDAARPSPALNPLYIDRTGGADRPIDHHPDFMVPFALATRHQAAAEVLARMEAMAYAGPLARGHSDPDSDKSPRSDGTYPIRLPNGHTVFHQDS